MAYKMKKSVGAAGLGANMRNVNSPAKQVATDPPLNSREARRGGKGKLRYSDGKMQFQPDAIYDGMLDEVTITPSTAAGYQWKYHKDHMATGAIESYDPTFDILSGGAGLALRAGVRGAGRAATKAAAKTMPTYNKMYRGLDLDDASSYITKEAQGFQHVSKNTNLNLGDIKTTEAVPIGRRSRGGRRTNSEVAAGTSDPRNALGGFYATATKKEVGGRAAIAGTAQKGQSTYTFSMPKGSKVLELPGTSNMSTGNLQEAADMGYDFIKGNDYGTGVEYIPLNKAKMTGFTMKPSSFKK
tara:strand:- start:110 stop:1006 length:897 start_codon:yes stop_codon:yes gene_type:complete